MDPEALKLLEGDLARQLDLVEATYEELEESARGDLAERLRLHSVALELHHLYCAIEDLALLVAEQFENQIREAPDCHLRLLRRAGTEIPGLRPALFSGKTCELQGDLRGFRHVLRHGYARTLDADRIRSLLEKARRLRPLVQSDVAAFLVRLRSA